MSAGTGSCSVLVPGGEVADRAMSCPESSVTVQGSSARDEAGGAAKRRERGTRGLHHKVYTVSNFLDAVQIFGPSIDGQRISGALKKISMV
ncbi:hypothetical protein ACFYZ5_39645 [Streptomyces chartreusis]|uniref:hypothetical protein n=1 Tax=Streptomyces chartreusis TaxID=1969 RepID=UPI00368DDA7A